MQQNAAPQKYNDNYEYEEEYVRSQNGARASNIIKGIVAAVIVFALVAGGIFGWRYLQNLTTSTNKTSDEIILPNFVGMIYDIDIKDNPDYADFTFEITYGNVPSKQPGEVLNQNPVASMPVKKARPFCSPSTARPSRSLWKT